VAGLYAALAGLAVYAVLGSSPVLSINPTATSSVLAAAAGAAFVTGGRYQAALAMAAIMAGAIAIAAGLARLGFLAQLLSRPVLIGYAGGAAIIITIGQTGNLLGVTVDARRATHVLTALPGSLGHASLTTLAVGLASIAALILLPRLLPRVPAALSGGFAVSSSFSCSAINAGAGARTRRAGAVTAAIVALCLLAATGLLHDLPMATLAAVTILSVVRLIPVRALRRLYRLQRDDFAVALAAVVGTVVLGILPGLGLAVARSIAGLLYRVTVGLRGPALDTFTRSDLGHDATPSILYPTVRQAVAASGIRPEPVGQGEDAGA
jgi:MFS superfamily sulfate permease-like transporter